MIEIDDINDRRIAPYRSLRKKASIDGGQETFVAEGEKVVRALLESSLEVLSVFALSHYYDKLGELIASRGVPSSALYVGGKELLKDIVGYRMHQGIMAVGRCPRSVPLQRLRGPIVALNGLCNAENVGSIVRNCAAFGVNSLIVDGKSSPPFLRRSVKVSMGAVFSMKVYKSPDLLKTLEALRAEREYVVVGAALDGPVVDVTSYRFPERYVLVVGTEGEGLEKRIIDACDVLVKVPISSCVESLNVAAATAVLLHSVARS